MSPMKENTQLHVKKHPPPLVAAPFSHCWMQVEGAVLLVLVSLSQFALMCHRSVAQCY